LTEQRRRRQLGAEGQPEKAHGRGHRNQAGGAIGRVTVSAHAALGRARGQSPMITALRVHWPYWRDDEALERFFAWLAPASGTFDELAFFTSETHPPLPLEVILDRARHLRGVMAQARTRGYRAGINLLATIGHHEENLPGSLNEPWQRVVDPHGRECRGCFCPEDPAFQDYVRTVYRALAEAEPEFIWVDDDVRLMGHMPVGPTCFCERCLAHFAQEMGKTVAREELADAIDGAPNAERLALRRAWVEHNRGVIDSLFKLIEETVHAVRPGLELGFMTGDRFYEGYAFRRWAVTLSGPGKAPVRWRPGGGFYSDEAPIGLVSKAHDIGRQVAALPEFVTVVQSELENFPYHLLRKSAHTTVTEAAAHMAAGASGVAFNIIAQDPQSIDEITPILERVAASRPFLSRLHFELGRSRALGVWPAWNGDAWAASADVGAPYSLAELGLPVCYDRGGASVVALAGRMPLAFPRDEVEAMLRGGVILDVPALEILWEMGLGEMTGVRPGGRFPVDAIEEFTEHELNGSAAGRTRNCRQSFWQQDARTVTAAADGARILSRLIDYGDNDLGECLSIFENPHGGRIAVAGYYPWTMITSAAKVWQYRALAPWLSRDRLPAVVETMAKVAIWVREGANGRRGVVLINCSLDAHPELAVWLRMAPGQVEHVPMDGVSHSLSTAPAPTEGYQRVVVREVAPWSVHLLLFAPPAEDR
jgi:hypothetical protein